MPKIIRNSTINLYLNSNQHFRVLLKLLPYFYLKKIFIFSIGNGQPIQETSTVPIVSAHFSINQSVDFYSGQSGGTTARTTMSVDDVGI